MKLTMAIVLFNTIHESHGNGSDNDVRDGNLKAWGRENQLIIEALKRES